MNVRRYHKSRYNHPQAKNGINPWARVIFWGIVAVLLLAVTTVRAQTVGKPFQAIVSVCLEEKDAVAITKTAPEDKAKADRMFDDAKGCANRPLSFEVLSVVYVVQDGDIKRKVVKIKVGDEYAYWLTSRDIKGFGEA